MSKAQKLSQKRRNLRRGRTQDKNRIPLVRSKRSNQKLCLKVRQKVQPNKPCLNSSQILRNPCKSPTIRKIKRISMIVLLQKRLKNQERNVQRRSYLRKRRVQAKLGILRNTLQWHGKMKSTWKKILASKRHFCAAMTRSTFHLSPMRYRALTWPK